MKKLLAITVLLSITACSNPFKSEWTGYLYPDRTDLTKHYGLGTFETLEECRDEAVSHRFYDVQESDYECGLNCKPNDYGLNICERTES